MAQQKVRKQPKKRPGVRKKRPKVQTVKVSRVIWIALVAITLAVGSLYLFVWNRVEPVLPGSYEYCVTNRGYVIKTDPAQCELDGTLYVEQIK